jgi:DNA-directed RNA polymerase subunit RPC12/RpoP
VYPEIVAAIQGIKALADLLKATHSLSNHSELLTAVHAVQMQLTDAIASALDSQEKEATLAARVRELEKEVADVRNWETDMRRYELFEFPSGHLAYALMRGLEQGEPMHYLCASCISNKKKSIMQPSGLQLRCPSCNTGIFRDRRSSPPPRRNGETWMSAW